MKIENLPIIALAICTFFSTCASAQAQQDASCTVPIKEYSGQGFGQSGKVTGGYSLAIKGITGTKVTAVFTVNRGGSGCGGEFETKGTCSGNKLSLKVLNPTPIRGCYKTVSLELEFNGDVLAGKYGKNIIDDPLAPNNMTLR